MGRKGKGGAGKGRVEEGIEGTGGERRKGEGRRKGCVMTVGGWTPLITLTLPSVCNVSK